MPWSTFLRDSKMLWDYGRGEKCGGKKEAAPAVRPRIASGSPKPTATRGVCACSRAIV